MRADFRGIDYSLNKKKRWLLPAIVEQRICESTPAVNKQQMGDDFDANLKIIMYVNTNTTFTSRCTRYANSQMEPHVIHRNGRRFNAQSLTKWMNFDTHIRRRHAHRSRRKENSRDRGFFGISQRPGFFPTEVTYTFTYPRRTKHESNRKGGKTDVRYHRSLSYHRSYYRSERESNRDRRRQRKTECNRMKSTYKTVEWQYEDEELAHLDDTGTIRLSP
jgi:hypothetical protein